MIRIMRGRAGLLTVTALAMIASGCGGQDTDTAGNAPPEPKRPDALSVQSVGGSNYGPSAAGIPASAGSLQPADSYGTPGVIDSESTTGASNSGGPVAYGANGTGTAGGFSAMGLDHDGLYAPLARLERAETAGLGDFGYGTVGLAQSWDGRRRAR